MNIATQDPHTFIIDQGEDFVVYQCFDQKWIIRGKCNCCGLCEVGAVSEFLVWSAEPGVPGACHDNRTNRLDNPVRPEISQDIPQCVLSGEYI